MIRLHSLKIPLKYTESDLRAAAARKLRISPKQITSLSVSRKSIDARRKNEIMYAMQLISEEEFNRNKDKLISHIDKLVEGGKWRCFWANMITRWIRKGG